MNEKEMSDFLEDMKYAIGQKLTSIKINGNDIWLILEDDMILIEQTVRCRCIDCVEKHEDKVVRG